MSVRKNYSCDLCGCVIGDTEGVGIIHKPDGEIESTWLKNDGAGRHLCHVCTKGLRAMFRANESISGRGEL